MFAHLIQLSKSSSQVVVTNQIRKLYFTQKFLRAKTLFHAFSFAKLEREPKASEAKCEMVDSIERLQRSTITFHLFNILTNHYKKLTIPLFIAVLGKSYFMLIPK
jgi:hypothetical protein